MFRIFLNIKIYQYFDLLSKIKIVRDVRVTSSFTIKNLTTILLSDYNGAATLFFNGLSFP